MIAIFRPLPNAGLDALRFVGLAGALLLTGCQHSPRRTMSEFWPQSWTGARSDPPPVTKPAEPSVSANVAASTTSKVAEQDAESTPGSVEGIATLADPATSKHIGETNVESPIDSLPEGTASSRGVSRVSQEAVVDSSDQVERLKAALDDDATRAREPVQQPAPHEVRARVESLLQRSRNLFDLGHLREARHTAKIAHDLGDSAKLDYSLDEERPIDLVQRIDDQLNEANSSVDPTATVSEDARKGDQPLSKEESPSKNIATENDSATRSRRDWGLSVFRRDRKSPATEQTVPTPAPSAASDTPVQLGLDANSDSDSTSDKAVVQANRSLTLTNQRDNSSSNRSSKAVASEEFDDEMPEEALDPPNEGNLPELASHQTVWLPEIPESPRKVDIDEPALPSAEFEEVKPLKPFRDVAGQSSTPVEPQRVECSSFFNYGWLGGTALFGICAAMAWYWYRRGAT